MSSTRRRKGSEKRSDNARLKLESLEPRVLLSAYLFVDFGDNFPGGTLATTQGAFRDVANDAVPGNRILGTTLDDGASAFNAATPLNIVAQAFTATERAQMMAVVRRDYLPMDVTVVELTANVQTTADGRNVAGAASMADVINTLRAGNAASKDEYVFVATFNVDPGGPNPATYGPGGGGNSPGGPRGTILDTVDLSSASNAHDDVVAVYSGGGLSNNTLNNIAHEAGHGFGLQHAITNATGTAAIDLFHQAEIMSYRNTNATTSSIAFTRYPMIRGDGNSPGGPLVSYNDLSARNGQVTMYDQLRLDANVLANPAYSFVSGTGAFDIITIVRNGNNADVSVQAFGDAAHTSPITVPGLGGTTYSYSFALTDTILVYAGGSDDQIIVDGDLGVNVQIDGMLGNDTLVVNGKGAANAVYTPNATSPASVDLGATDFGGTVSIGGSLITFADFELAGSVTIQNVSTLTYVAPPAGADQLVVNLAGGIPQVAGTVNDGTGVVPLLLQTVNRLAVDTGVANDQLTVDSSNGLVAFANGIDFDGGAGRDGLTLAQTGGATQTSDVYSVGPDTGQGTSVITGPSGIQAVQFENIEPVLDLVPATTLTVNATPADNAINYRAGAAGNGLVTIDNFESIEFSNKTNLVIDALAGSDEINLNNPSTPTGLTGTITVNGSDPTASDTLIVNGVPAALDNLRHAPTGFGAGTVVNDNQPQPNVIFTGIEHLQLVLLAADGDGARLDGTVGNDLFEYTQGPGDSGVFTGTMDQNNASGSGPFALTETTFLNANSLANDTDVNFFGNVGGTDTFLFNGTAANDTIAVIGGEAGGTEFRNTIAGQVVARVEMFNIASGLARGLDGNDTFNVTVPAGPAAVALRVEGGAGTNTLNHTAPSGSATTIDLGASSITATAPAGNPVTFAGIATLNEISAGAGSSLTVRATAGDDTLRVRPTGANEATILLAGAPVVNASAAGTLTLDTLAGTDAVIVEGSDFADTFTVVGNAVTIAGKKTVNATNHEALVVDALGGNDIVTASGAPTGLIVDGGTGDDDLNASAATTAARLFGEAGNDVLHAAAGGGLLNGGDDDDVFLVNGGLTGVLLVEGGEPSHSDVLALTGAAATVETVTIAPDAVNPTNQSVTGLGATITATGIELIRYTGVGADDTLTVSMGGADGTARVDRGVGVDRVVSNVLPQIEFTGLSTFAVNTFGGTQQVTFETSDLAGALPGNYQMQAGFGDTLIIEGGDTEAARDIYTVTNPAGAPSVAVTDGSPGSTGVTVTETSGGLGRLQINGLGGDDTVTVNVNGPASDVIGVPITFDGGPGADSLTVTGTPTTAVANVTQTPGTERGDGRLRYTNAGGATLMTIDYVSLQPVTDLVVATTVTVNGTNLANVIKYTTGSVATRGLVVVDDYESLEFSNKAHLVINGLAGNDEIDIDNASTPTSLLDITANGGGLPGVDTLIVDGTAAADTMALTATGLAAGNVAVNAQPLVSFTGIGALTLRGGDGADTFTPAGAVALAGIATLDGGQGDDTFAIGAYLGKLKLLGDDGSDTVDVATSTVGVTLDLDLLNDPQKANNVGLNVTLADAIENFVGSPFNDKVSVDALAVPRSIDGGAPTKVTPPVIPPGDLLTVDGENQFVDVNRIDPATGQPSKDSGTVTAFSFEPIAFTDIEKLSIVDTLGSVGFGSNYGLPAYTPGANYSLVGKNPGDKRWAAATASGNLDPNNPDPNFTGNLWQDLVVVHNRGKGLANVFLNRGDGTFLQSDPFTTGLNNVTSVALTDVDGDGALDIVAAGTIPLGLFKGFAALSVMTGNNDGTFNAFTLTVSSLKGALTSMAVGDVDGTFAAPLNGPDIVLTNGKKIRVFLNDGAGTFTEQAVLLPSDPLNKGNNVRQLQLADLDADGQLDLAAAAYKANKVSVFLNTGAGTFGAPTSFAVAGTPRSLAIGDLNLDGINDIAVASTSKTGVSVLLGNGDGTFARQPQAASLKNLYESIALGDVNSDGKLDLVMTREVEPTTDIQSVYVLLGAGNGTFATNPYVFSAHDTEHNQPAGLALADFNSDGGLDIACVGAGSFDVSLLLKNTVI